MYISNFFSRNELELDVYHIYKINLEMVLEIDVKHIYKLSLN